MFCSFYVLLFNHTKPQTRLLKKKMLKFVHVCGSVNHSSHMDVELSVVLCIQGAVSVYTLIITPINKNQSECNAT